MVLVLLLLSSARKPSRMEMSVETCFGACGCWCYCAYGCNRMTKFSCACLVDEPQRRGLLEALARHLRERLHVLVEEPRQQRALVRVCLLGMAFVRLVYEFIRKHARIRTLALLDPALDEGLPPDVGLVDVEDAGAGHSRGGGVLCVVCEEITSGVCRAVD